MDVVIVGAGVGGLTCAHAVMQAGKQVLVLEARKRVGGEFAAEHLPRMS